MPESPEQCTRGGVEYPVCTVNNVGGFSDGAKVLGVTALLSSHGEVLSCRVVVNDTEATAGQAAEIIREAAERLMKLSSFSD